MKKIIKDAANILGINENDENAKRTLGRAAKSVVGRIASMIDCVAEQNFSVTNGRIDYSEFKHTILRVKSCSVPFDSFPTFIRVPNGPVRVTYDFIPKGLVKGFVSETTLLYGTIAEFAGMMGLRDEEKIFNEKFNIALFYETRTGRAKKVAK